MKKRFSVVYSVLEPLVFASISLWHRRLEIEGVSDFPNGPVLLIANHQNGMEDPLVCCVSTPRQCHFLTRADIFQTPLSNRILRGLNMIPVYRPRDRRQDARDRNADSFARAQSRLEAGCIIAMFPEGNHRNRRSLRPFKSGMARIGMEALESWSAEPNRPDDITVVPVGLDYSDYTAFRSDLLLNFGKGFKLKPYLEDYRVDPQSTVSRVMERAKHALQEHMLDLEAGDRYSTVLALRDIDRHRRFPSDPRNAPMKADLVQFKQTAHRTESMPESDFQALKEALEAYHKAADSLGLKPELLGQKDLKAFRIICRSLWAIGGLPIYVLGLLANGIPAAAVRYIVDHKVRDVHFKSSFGFASAVFLFVFWYVFLSIMITTTLGIGWVPLVLIAAAISGILALRFRESLRVMLQAIKFRRLLTRKNPTLMQALALLKSIQARIAN